MAVNPIESGLLVLTFWSRLYQKDFNLDLSRNNFDATCRLMFQNCI